MPSVKIAKGEMKKNLLNVLLLLTLFSSLGFTALFYVECDNVYLDEWLDLFGMNQPTTTLKVIVTTQPTAFFILISDGHFFWLHHSGSFCSDQFSIEPPLSLPLRC